MSSQQASHTFSTDKAAHGTLKNSYVSGFAVNPGHWKKEVNSSPYPALLNTVALLRLSTELKSRTPGELLKTPILR